MAQSMIDPTVDHPEMLRTPYETRIKAEAETERARSRLATERRLQLLVLIVAAAIVLVVSVWIAGPRNVFLPHWWRIDLP